MTDRASLPVEPFGSGRLEALNRAIGNAAKFFGALPEWDGISEWRQSLYTLNSLLALGRDWEGEVGPAFVELLVEFGVAPDDALWEFPPDWDDPVPVFRADYRTHLDYLMEYLGSPPHCELLTYRVNQDLPNVLSRCEDVEDDYIQRSIENYIASHDWLGVPPELKKEVVWLRGNIHVELAEDFLDHLPPGWEVVEEFDGGGLSVSDFGYYYGYIIQSPSGDRYEAVNRYGYGGVRWWCCYPLED